jgi:hypothetical protein
MNGYLQNFLIYKGRKVTKIKNILLTTASFIFADESVVLWEHYHICFGSFCTSPALMKIVLEGTSV